MKLNNFLKIKSEIHLVAQGERIKYAVSFPTLTLYMKETIHSPCCNLKAPSKNITGISLLQKATVQHLGQLAACRPHAACEGKCAGFSPRHLTFSHFASCNKSQNLQALSSLFWLLLPAIALGAGAVRQHGELRLSPGLCSGRNQNHL